MTQELRESVTEAVGVFDAYDDLVETIKDLGAEGFGRHQISVRGSDEALEEQFGSRAISAAQLEDAPQAPRSPLISAEELGIAQGVLIGVGIYIGAVVAFIALNGLAHYSSLLTVIVGCIAGGVAGSALAWVLGREYSGFFEKQLSMGGLVLWVETPDAEQAEKATDILQRHGAHDVHLHQMPLAA